LGDHFRPLRIPDVAVPPRAGRSDLSADERKKSVLSVGIGGRLQLRTEETRCPDASVDGLQVREGHGAGFSIKAVICADGPGEVPRVNQQIPERETEARPGWHLAKREGDDLIHRSGCTERLVGRATPRLVV